LPPADHIVYEKREKQYNFELTLTLIILYNIEQELSTSTIEILSFFKNQLYIQLQIKKWYKTYKSGYLY